MSSISQDYDIDLTQIKLKSANVQPPVKRSAEPALAPLAHLLSQSSVANLPPPLPCPFDSLWAFVPPANECTAADIGNRDRAGRSCCGIGTGEGEKQVTDQRSLFSLSKRFLEKCSEALKKQGSSHGAGVSVNVNEFTAQLNVCLL